MTNECETNSNSHPGSSDAISRGGVIDFKVTNHDGEERIVSALWKGRDVSSEDSENDPKDSTTQSMVDVTIKSDGLFDNDICFPMRGGKDLIEKFECVDESVKRELCIRVMANSLDDPYKVAHVNFDGVGSNLMATLR